MSNSDKKARLAAAARLECEIESKTRSTPAEGFAINAYGAYEPVAVREREFETYRELMTRFPEDDYIPYLYAASLSRSGFLEEAARFYRGVIDGRGAYAAPAQKMLAGVLYRSDQRAAAQQVLDEYNELRRNAGERVWHERVEHMFCDDNEARTKG